MEANDLERGRPAYWTIYRCARCGLAKFDDADMVIHSRDCGGTFEPVEVVPIERLWRAVEDFSKAKRLLDALEGR